MLCRRDENVTEFRKRHALGEKPIIALLPGSRRQEISACLPTMIEAAESFSGYQVVISGAPGIESGFYKQFCETTSHPVITGDTYQMLVCKSSSGKFGYCYAGNCPYQLRR